MNKIKVFFLIITAYVMIISCTGGYSFTGSSIPPEVKTFSVQQFLNVSTMVAPILSITLTEGLIDKFTRQTSLSPVKNDGDFAFEGEIVGYSSSQAAISAEEHATLNRLTITIKVKFVNKFDPKASFSRNFSRYQDYDSSIQLQEVELTLIPEIVEELVTDIFNASASNW